MRYEKVMILRSEVELDEMGDEVRSDFKDHLELTMKFAPSNSSEPVEVGRKSVITGGTLYARDLNELPDVNARDRARVRGVEYEIEGDIGSWLRADTWAIQFAIKDARG